MDGSYTYVLRSAFCYICASIYEATQQQQPDEYIYIYICLTDVTVIYCIFYEV